MSKEEWIFTPDMLDSVCNGDFCPKCLSTDVKCVGHNPDGVNMNAAYDCQECGEQWEGY